MAGRKMLTKKDVPGERFCKRCHEWVTPERYSDRLYGIDVPGIQCPRCTYAMNFSQKREMVV